MSEIIKSKRTKTIKTTVETIEEEIFEIESSNEKPQRNENKNYLWKSLKSGFNYLIKIFPLIKMILEFNKT